MITMSCAQALALANCIYDPLSYILVKKFILSKHFTGERIDDWERFLLYVAEKTYSVFIFDKIYTSGIDENDMVLGIFEIGEVIDESDLIIAFAKRGMGDFVTYLLDNSGGALWELKNNPEWLKEISDKECVLKIENAINKNAN